jgi:hypothetical protein
MGRRQGGFCASIPAAGCKRKANAAFGQLPPQPHRAVDTRLIFGVARWGKTAGVLPLRFAPEK